MANGHVGDGLWAFVVIGGFIILAAAIAFAKLRNKVSPQQERRTEQATDRLYKEESARDSRPEGQQP